MRIKRKCRCRKHTHAPGSLDDIHARCKETQTILKTCDKVYSYRASWTWLAQCRVCNTLWCVEHPFPELHTGGTPCAYAVPTPKHVQEDYLAKLRRREEQQQHQQ